MNARLYDAYSDDFSLSQLEVGRYESFTISHVLEHFDDTAAVMRKLWRACARLGVTTVVAVVPGAKGYAYDSTHKTFVTQAWLRQNGLSESEGFVLDKADYFPIDAEATPFPTPARSLYGVVSSSSSTIEPSAFISRTRRSGSE